jgi:putative FmdB family regulatory protein
MPIYEYACAACGHRFEEWQKMSDKPVRTCPKCKAKKVEKLISQTSFTLKGGGWYSDLYAGPKPGASSKGEAGASSEASESSTKDSAKDSTKDSKKDSTKDTTKDTKKADSAAKPAAEKAKKKTGAA